MVINNRKSITIPSHPCVVIGGKVATVLVCV